MIKEIVKNNTSRLKRISKEAIWIIFGNFATFAGSLFLIKILTEKLTPSQYGELTLALTFNVLASLVLFSGITSGLNRFFAVACSQKDLKGYLKASKKLVGYGILFILGFGFTVLISMSFTNLQNLVNILLITIFYTLFVSINSSLNSIQQASRQRSVVAIHTGLDAWLKIVFVIILTKYFGANTITILSSYVISLILIIISQYKILQIFIIKNKNLSSKSSSKTWIREILNYSWPFSAWGLFQWLQQVSDKWSLEKFSTRTAVGQYSALFQVGYAPIGIITGFLTTLIGPILYEKSGDAKNSQNNKIVHNTTWVITAIGLFLTLLTFIILFFNHKYLYSLVVAEAYRESSYLLPWVALAGGLYACGQMLALKHMSELNSKKLLDIKIYTSLIAVSLNIYFSYKYGLNGIVFSIAFFSFINLLWMMYKSRKALFYKE